MEARDRAAIDDLFGKIAEVEQRAGSRDAEAEGHIRSSVARQPAAPYFMAQTIIVQEQALEAAQARIEELERQGSRGASGGGLLSGIFGGAQPQQQRPSGRLREQQATSGPWSNAGAGRGGGGFLAGAAQTAMGVAGGVLLGNAITGMFGSDEASAGDVGADTGDAGMEADAGADAGMDTGGGDFDLGDF